MDGNFPSDDLGSVFPGGHHLPADPPSGFELADFLYFGEFMEEEYSDGLVSGFPRNPTFAADESAVIGAGGSSSSPVQGSPDAEEYGRTKESKEVVREKVAFKTKSEIEIMDDGFKWRKYGKKMVKNSPNPRNYYRCLADGCPVKKRVERDREDSRYVITTYEGVHNHQGPAL